MNLLHAIFLGIVQGVTEWLPISSSGHLVLFQTLFGLDQPIIFDIFLHLGSLIVILIVFWKDLAKLLEGVLKKDKKAIKFVLYLAIASIPIALAGFFLNDLIKSAFESTRTVGFSLLLTAILLFFSKYPKKKRKKLSLKSVIWIGFAQALAILPGVSRSGSTISAGLMNGVNQEDTARFSFLLFIPAILGATALELNGINSISNIPALIAGTLTTIMVGILSLRFLLRILKKGKLHHFGWYCLALGLIILLV